MTLQVGDKAPDYSLRNSNPEEGGDVLSLSDSIEKRGCVVVFECNHCPYVVASVDRINAMSTYCNEQEIGFVGINSNDPVNYPADSFENMVKRAQKGMPYPYLHDPTQVTATATALIAVGEALNGTSTTTQTDAEIEAQIIEELGNMDATTTSTSTTTTSSTGTSTSTSTSTGT